MKKTLLITVLLTLLTSCESNKDSCIRRLIDEKGYSDADAKEMCDEGENDSVQGE